MDPQVVELPSLPGVTGVLETPLRNGIMNPTLNGDMEIRDGTIFAKKLVVGVQSWIHNLVWTATDYNTATWGSGTLQMADGTQYAIAGGNTGNIVATTYVYFDRDVSPTTLQTTTTFSNATGNNKILLAICSPVVDTTALVIITPIGAQGTTIDGDHISTPSLSAISAILGDVVVGGTGNGDGTITVRDASNNDKVMLNKDGVTIIDGLLTFQNDDGDTSIDAKGVVSLENFVTADSASAFTGSILQTITGSGGSAVTSDISGATLSFTLARDAFVTFRAKIVGVIGIDLSNHFVVNGTLLLDLDGTDVDQAIEQARRRTSPADDAYGNAGVFYTNEVMFSDTLATGSHTVKLKGKIQRVTGSTTNPTMLIYMYYIEYVILGT